MMRVIWDRVNILFARFSIVKDTACMLNFCWNDGWMNRWMDG